MWKKRRRKGRGRCEGGETEGSSGEEVSREVWTGSGRGGCGHCAISRFYGNMYCVKKTKKN